ncbi:MAG: GNAT family N-acetyltransferase, partial [Rhodospirillales bacterium]|nr:GNAT family N-acetyltransferase [Rhodospirillales bacterium]
QHSIHHVRDRGYVQAPVRIRSILGELEKSGLFERIEARRFSGRRIREIHEGAMVDYVTRACRATPPHKSIYPYVFPIRNAARPPKEATVRAGYYCIDTFTPLNRSAYLAARRAVDCALTAADLVLEDAPLAYALVRPPGHHAERRAFGGFCYFNNAAIAANYLSAFGKVAVLDIDYHHGNGTQDIFYERDDVLTVSIHGHPSFAYPYFAGFSDETGQGRGAGYNLNIPLAEHITPERHREAVERALRRIARHNPAYLVLSVGFDTAKGDPTGTWSNRAADFEALGRLLGQAGHPTVVVQEGGYRVRTLGINARRFFTGLARGVSEAWARAPKRPRREAEPVVPALEWRESLQPENVEDVRSLVMATGMFSSEETAVAAELVAERIAKGPASGYEFLLAEMDGRLVGYTCFGPVPGTKDRWDLYWIAVRPDTQRAGIGRELMARAESVMAAHGAKRIYLDTSTAEKYAASRAFYRAAGYRKAAELPDFYRDGDGKVIFMKTVP